MSLRSAHCSFAFCMGHRLLDYEGKCRNIHGHNCELEIAVTSETLTQEGFIMDFSALKSITKTWIDEYIDHGFIANSFDAVVLDLLNDQELKHYSLTPTEMKSYYEFFGLSFPNKDRTICNPTMENLVVFITYTITRLLKKASINVDIVSVKLRESGSGWVEFEPEGDY